MAKPSLYDFPEVIRDCWVVHEAFRRLGFSADDIYVMVSTNGRQDHRPPWIFMLLRTQGKELAVSIGALAPMTDVALQASWQQFCAHFNADEFDKDEAHKVFADGLGNGAESLIRALVTKGFSLPADGLAWRDSLN